MSAAYLTYHCICFASFNSYPRHCAPIEYHHFWRNVVSPYGRGTQKFCSPCPNGIKLDGCAHQQAACCSQERIRHVSSLPTCPRLSAYTPVLAPPLILVPTCILILWLVSNLWALEMRCLFSWFDTQHSLTVHLHAFTDSYPLYPRVSFVESQSTWLYSHGTSRDTSGNGWMSVLKWLCYVQMCTFMWSNGENSQSL